MLFIAYIALFDADRDDMAFVIERATPDEARRDIEDGLSGEEWDTIDLLDEADIREQGISLEGIERWT